MKATKKSIARATAAVSLPIILAAGLGRHAAHRIAKPPVPLVYTSAGYGGFVPAPKLAAHKPVPAAARSGAAIPVPALEQTVRDAYVAGRYAAVEMAGAQVIKRAAQFPTLSNRQAAARARSLLAYSAARRHDLPLARVRFAVMQAEAARLPDKGLETAPPGAVAPTLEAEAAFQHAVCTGALGDKAGAEVEYVAFMKHYPDSPLLHAALLRLQKMHGGDLTSVDAAVWQQAKQTAQARQMVKEREASLCGPECLAELLRRRGEAPDVHALARAMGTSERGTTLAAMASAARGHGFPAQGLALTPKGLAEQALPVIALVAPGHYVLVEAITPSGVTVWDPDARGVGHADRRTVPQPMWGRMWQGVTLALRPPTQAVRTAQR